MSTAPSIELPEPLPPVNSRSELPQPVLGPCSVLVVDEGVIYATDGGPQPTWRPMVTPKYGDLDLFQKIAELIGPPLLSVELTDAARAGVRRVIARKLVSLAQTASSLGIKLSELAVISAQPVFDQPYTAPGSAPGARDWPDDFNHENGRYLNRCIVCNQQFMGHKRRLTCRVCAASGAPSHNPKT